jgi:hypothetical protein
MPQVRIALAQVTSVRIMPWLRSRISIIALSAIGA